MAQTTSRLSRPVTAMRRQRGHMHPIPIGHPGLQLACLDEQMDSSPCDNLAFAFDDCPALPRRGQFPMHRSIA